MPSGKKERVVISCVTFEVAKITQPAVYYEATRVHLIHYGEDVYREFYDEVCRRLNKELPKAEIVDHVEVVSDFKKMMNTVLKIIKKEKFECRENGVEIYVNISAGSSEYSAASLLASMMIDGVTPFNVPSLAYQVSKEKVKEIYYENGKPVGLMKECKDPVALSTYSVESPDRNRLLALGILKKHMDDKAETSATAMIPDLASKDLMECKYKDRESRGRKVPTQNTVMNYQRNFVNFWIHEGWVVKTSKRSMKITEDGLNVLDVFKESYEYEFNNCSGDTRYIS